jgi:hypothetical protein
MLTLKMILGSQGLVGEGRVRRLPANQGVPSDIIEMICRWRKVERAQGRQPNLGMREHYMEVTQALEAFLQYSRPL